MKLIATLTLLALSANAADHKVTSIFVRVVPEAVVSVQGTTTVSVRIRLSQAGAAQVWVGDNCATPLPNSQVIRQSGEYSFPLATVPGTGKRVCLTSAIDGLFESAPLPVARTADVVTCTNNTCYVL